MALSIKNVIGKLQTLLSFSKGTWKENEYFDEQWKERIKKMSFFIPPSAKTIMDLGCGKMWLKDYISSNCTYYGVDYKKRDDKTEVCDFNKKEFPDKKADVIFISGCLEYLLYPDWFIMQVSTHSKRAILSYCVLDVFPNKQERKNLYWVNHLSEKEIIQKFHDNSMLLRCKERTETNNSIFVFDNE